MYPPRRSFPIHTSLATASSDDITGYIGTPSGQSVATVNPIPGEMFPGNRIDPRDLPVAGPEGRPGEIDVEGLDGIIKGGANPFRDALIDMIGMTPVGTETGFGDGRFDFGEFGVSFDGSGGAWMPNLGADPRDDFDDTGLVSGPAGWWHAETFTVFNRPSKPGQPENHRDGYHDQTTWYLHDKDGNLLDTRLTPPPGWDPSRPDEWQPGDSRGANGSAAAHPTLSLVDILKIILAILGLRPDPNESGIPRRLLLSAGEMNRLVSAIQAPPWQSDVREKERRVSMVDVDWSMVRGGGHTDPVPFEETSLRGSVAVSPSVYRSPATDGPAWNG